MGGRRGRDGKTTAKKETIGGSRQLGQALQPLVGTDCRLLSIEKTEQVVERFFNGLAVPVRKNLVLLVDAFVTLTAGLRSGNGALTLAAIARAVRLPTTFKDRYKRVNRFLDNHLFDPHGVTEGLFAAVVGVTATLMLPVILDQSAINASQLLLAGIPQAGRVLPLALWVFTYADIRNRPKREKSQNYIERLFILRLLTAVPHGVHLCFILDRGYARVSLVRELLLLADVNFVLRTKRNVIVERLKRGRWKQCKVGDLTARHGRPCRLERIRYHGKTPIELDLIIYFEQGHKEPWYLLVPPGSSQRLPTDQVVCLYRQRMHIEQGFRDFKTHLGVRGLQLQVRISLRVQRLLQAFMLAYAMIVSLGMTRVAQKARIRLEDARAKARHNTERILSARTVAAMLLAGLCLELLAEVSQTVHLLIRNALAGKGLYNIAPRL